MNTATIMDLAWEGAQVAFRLIMAARSRGDAEAIVHQLRALGPAERANVDAVEQEARRRLAPDFDSAVIGGRCMTCGGMPGDHGDLCPYRGTLAGDLDGGE